MSWRAEVERLETCYVEEQDRSKRLGKRVQDLRAQVARLEAQIEQESAIDVERLEAIGRMGTQLQQLQSIRPFVRAVVAEREAENDQGRIMHKGMDTSVAGEYDKATRRVWDKTDARRKAADALPDDVVEWAKEGE